MMQLKSAQSNQIEMAGMVGKIRQFLLLGCSSLLLVACGGAEENTAQLTPEATSQAQAPQTKPADPYPRNPEWKTYLVGSETNYAPFEFRDEHGQPTGFEVELLQEVAKASQFNVEFVTAKRNTMEETLDSGKFQIWASAFSISPERLQKVDMSKPYLDYERTLWVLDTPQNQDLKSADDFKGKKIATYKNSGTNFKKIEEMGAKVVTADSFFLLMGELMKNNADAVMGDSRVFQYHQLLNEDLKTKIISLGEQPKQFAFVVQKGNTPLLEKINQGLDKVKADGTLDYLIEKWFGETKGETHHNNKPPKPTDNPPEPPQGNPPPPPQNQ